MYNQVNQNKNKKQLKNRLISQIAILIVKKKREEKKRLEFNKLKSLSIKNSSQLNLF